MTAKQLEETLTTIAGKAKALRDAGVIGVVTIGDISFALDTPDSPPVNTNERATDASLGNPLDDGDTYGGHVPRRRGAPADDEQEE